MGKINFTPEHMERMKVLLLDMLLNNSVIISGFGNELNACTLLHTTTINNLNNIRIGLGKNIETLENTDEWVNSNNQHKIQVLKEKKELVNLIIGYKRYMEEVKALEAKRKELEEKLNTLKESQKTPEDRIKEIEAQIAELG